MEKVICQLIGLGIIVFMLNWYVTDCKKVEDSLIEQYGINSYEVLNYYKGF